ncbi:MAG: hypothetical protein ABIG64_00960 [Candidatus Omnitrophota bacterium]
MPIKKFKCDSCGLEFNKQQKYCAKIELFANPQVELSENDLKQNTRQKINEIIQAAKNIDVNKLEEDVYICYHLNLCKRCRDVFLQRLKLKEFI